jgi:membrane protein
MKSISNFTIVFALIFATNGTSLINGFNENTEEKTVMFRNIFCLFYYYWFYYYFFSLLGIYYSEVVLKLFTPEYDITWLVNNLPKSSVLFLFHCFISFFWHFFIGWVQKNYTI